LAILAAIRRVSSRETDHAIASGRSRTKVEATTVLCRPPRKTHLGAHARASGRSRTTIEAPIVISGAKIFGGAAVRRGRAANVANANVPAAGPSKQLVGSI